MIASDIFIEVQTRYLPEHSSATDNRYAFAYEITINNKGTEAARLRSRYWLITDGDGNTQEVQGAGVVGQEPRIEPGASYSYTSGAVLETPIGSMQGHYIMELDSGDQFEADIPIFRLLVPGALN